MTRRDDLIKLRDAVRAGEAGGSDFCNVWPAMNDKCWPMNKAAYRAYDGSLDAAKALHEAVLPGAYWFIGHLDEPSLFYVATVAQGHFADSPSWRGYAMIPARAWLLAILDALIAQEPAPMTQEGGE
jgi:hypothetical protein